jgi:hypothetical protein
MGLDFILILVGVILLFIAAFGGAVRYVDLFRLGVALIALTLLTGCGDREDRVVNEHLSTNEVVIEENEARPKDEVCRPSAGETCP